MTRLTELSPRWRVDTEHGLHPDRQGMGINFACPVHGMPCMLGVWFANPLDGGAPAASQWLWTRTGDTFETLTLSPSIHAKDIIELPDGKRETTHWHGHITKGEVT